MSKSDNINEIVAALSKAQGAMTHAGKDAANPHFKSKFASLASVIDAIREPFAKNGLAFFHAIRVEGAQVLVECTIAHSSGQWISSVFSASAQDTRPQSVGSCISYGKRYSLQALAGIASADEDDDGEQAQGRSAQQHKPTPPAPASTPLKQAFDAAVARGISKTMLLGKASEIVDAPVNGAGDIPAELVANVIAAWGSIR